MSWIDTNLCVQDIYDSPQDLNFCRQDSYVFPEKCILGLWNNNLLQQEKHLVHSRWLLACTMFKSWYVAQTRYQLFEHCACRLSSSCASCATEILMFPLHISLYILCILFKQDTDFIPNELFASLAQESYFIPRLRRRD